MKSHWVRSVVVFVFMVVTGAVVSSAHAQGMSPVQAAADALRAETPSARLFENGSRITRVYGQAFSHGVTAQAAADQKTENYGRNGGHRRAA